MFTYGVALQLVTGPPADCLVEVVVSTTVLAGI